MNKNTITDKGNTHILIAEDSEFNQEVMQQQLAILGYNADFAINGKVALRMLSEKKYHILLTDIQMPEMNGFELVEQIRRLEMQGEYRLPVIAITADDITVEAEHCLAADMDAIVSKPLDLEHLEQTLETWLPKTPVTIK